MAIIASGKLVILIHRGGGVNYKSTWLVNLISMGKEFSGGGGRSII